MSLFHGLSAFPITPSDAQGRVDTDNMARLTDRLVQAKAGSIGVLGSTGTYAYLAQSERARAVTAAAEAKGDTPLIAGVSALSTREAVSLAKDAQNAGADALLLAPMSYTALTQDEVFTHFETVAVATDLPLVIYNNPGTTHFAFGLPLLERLAGLPTIRAVKMPLPSGTTLEAELATLRNALPADFTIGYSGDWGCGDALLVGADAWFSVLGGILPEMADALTKKGQAGDAAGVAAINAELEPLWDLFQTHGSLRIVYKMAQHLGLTTAEPPRPLLPVDDALTRKIRQITDNLTSGV